MSELAQIVCEAAALRVRGAPFMLATVVRVCGSAYRRPGARMLFAEDRWLGGSVSGGCLERDVLRRGAFRTRHGSPVVVRYDGSSDDDAQGAGVGAGCSGFVDVLLERIGPDTELDPTRFFADCFEAEEVGALATVITDGGAEPLGVRVAARGSRIWASTMKHAGSTEILAHAALDALTEGRPRSAILERGGLAVLVERFVPPARLFVVGTRHDAVAVAEVASVAGFDVTVANVERAFSPHARFAPSVRHFTGVPDELARVVGRCKRAAVLLMTHDHVRDRACLSALLVDTAALYVGVLGPRARTSRMLEESKIAMTPERRARLYAPVGLDLGAETPREIALAVVAEVHAVLNGASCAHLRDRRGPIHGRLPELPEPIEKDALA